MKILTLLALLAAGPVITNDCDGCPPTNDTSATAATVDDSGTSTDNPTTSGADVTATGSESSAGIEPTGDIVPDTSCNATPDWCNTLLAWCPFIFTQSICDNDIAVNDCDAQTNIFAYCKPGYDACMLDPMMTASQCVIAQAKCEAAYDVFICEAQPAAFTCAYGDAGKTYCTNLGYAWTPNGNYCRPACEEQEDCGPSEYAYCHADGFCTPKVLILCF